METVLGGWLSAAADGGEKMDFARLRQALAQPSRADLLSTTTDMPGRMRPSSQSRSANPRKAGFEFGDDLAHRITGDGQTSLSARQVSEQRRDEYSCNAVYAPLASACFFHNAAKTFAGDIGKTSRCTPTAS